MHTKQEDNSQPYIGTFTSTKTKSGGDVVTRKYNPKTREWDCKAVKVEKGYDYFPVLISKILKRMVDDNEVGGVTRATDLNTSDLALIFPTIAHIPLPRTKEIVERRSRFVIELSDTCPFPFYTVHISTVIVLTNVFRYTIKLRYIINYTKYLCSLNPM